MFTGTGVSNNDGINVLSYTHKSKAATGTWPKLLKLSVRDFVDFEMVPSKAGTESTATDSQLLSSK